MLVRPVLILQPPLLEASVVEVHAKSRNGQEYSHSMVSENQRLRHHLRLLKAPHRSKQHMPRLRTALENLRFRSHIWLESRILCLEVQLEGGVYRLLRA
jgi:hypothetical protein